MPCNILEQETIEILSSGNEEDDGEEEVEIKSTHGNN